MAAAEHGDRGRRAQAYVEGRMSPAEREAAEHLLEVDGAFRLAVVDAAERLGLLPRTDAVGVKDWGEIRQKLAALPHMPTALAGPAAQASPSMQASGARGRAAEAWPAFFGRLLRRLHPWRR